MDLSNIDLSQINLSDPETYKAIYGSYPPGYSAPNTGATPGGGIAQESGTLAMAQRNNEPPKPVAPPKPVFNPNTFQIKSTGQNPDLQRGLDAGGSQRFYDLDYTNTDLKRQLAAGEIDQDYFDKASAWLTPQLQQEGVTHYSGIGESQLRNLLAQRLGGFADRYGGDINREIDFIKQGLPTGVDPRTIPSNYFNRSGFNNIFSVLNDRYSRDSLSDFRSRFQSPYSLIDDTADDDAINSIVGEQADNAKMMIDRQHKRGALNDFGYNKALSNLDVRRGQVSSRLQERGKSLLDTLRERAQGIYNTEESKAAGSTLDNPYDFTSGLNQFNSAINTGKSNLTGQIRDLASPDEFNINELLGQSYSAQGPTNKSSPVLAALEQRKKIQSNNRGLGSTGAF